MPLFERTDRSHVGADFDELRGRGLAIALIAHGSEFRDPDAHMARSEHSFYRNAPSAWVDALRRLSGRNRELARTLPAPLFVSTPDLLLDAPDGRWLPLCVDMKRWQTTEAALGRDTPVVLHLPSRRRPGIKGTETIDAVLRPLAEAKKISYVSPPQVRSRDVPRLVRSADVVVEQIRTGSYGVTAVEAMAAGRLVVGFVDRATRQLMPEQPPIVDAPPPQFADVMQDVLHRRDPYRLIAARGTEFAARWHDGAASAKVLATFLS